MARKKTTMYVEEDLITAVKVTAAREGKREYEVIEEALRERLGMVAVLEKVWASNRDLSAEQAMALANEAVDAVRREGAGSGAGASAR